MYLSVHHDREQVVQARLLCYKTPATYKTGYSHSLEEPDECDIDKTIHLNCREVFP